MIQFMRGSKSQLDSLQTILPSGQPVFEEDSGQLKIGNGSARYSTLPYVGSIFESSGGNESDVGIVTGDDSEGYADFPNGLRICWGEALVSITVNWSDLENGSTFVHTTTNTRFTPPNVKSTILTASFVSTVPPIIIDHVTNSNSHINLYFLSPHNRSAAMFQYMVLSV